MQKHFSIKFMMALLVVAGCSMCRNRRSKQAETRVALIGPHPATATTHRSMCRGTNEKLVRYRTYLFGAAMVRNRVSID
ncbi:hypothetical protein GGR55DRAFT_626037 [Xylaria sp. FL0064]|nr:hypothetical protein GGR55DRAFT_626037 [Xylaria sp. FL0064]